MNLHTITFDSDSDSVKEAPPVQQRQSLSHMDPLRHAQFCLEISHDDIPVVVSPGRAAAVSCVP
jgi:hypothetical protein